MELEYTLSRTQRKTISIKVKDCKLSVCAPLNTNIETIERYIFKKCKWINEKLNIQKANVERLAQFLNYEKFLFLGKTLLPIYDSTKIITTDSAQFIIPQKYYLDNTKIIDNRKLLNAIYKFYTSIASEKLYNILYQLSQKYNMPFNSFKITNAKTKWGSCDSLNNIMLNWRLVFFSTDVIEYVAIHELAHTIEHNHSKSFWSIVNKYDNQYKKKKANIKEFGLLISLF